MYTGVGARRIRETFDMMRNFAPAILFVDEARGPAFAFCFKGSIFAWGVGGCAWGLALCFGAFR